MGAVAWQSLAAIETELRLTPVGRRERRPSLRLSGTASLRLRLTPPVLRGYAKAYRCARGCPSTPSRSATGGTLRH